MVQRLAGLGTSALIPFFELPPYVSIGPLELRPFGLLVAVGIASGYLWFRRRLRQGGWGDVHVAGMAFWMVLAGLAGAAILKLLYLPNFLQTLRQAPGEVLRNLGIASFGGLFAGLLGGYGYLRLSRLPPAALWAHFDALAFVFPRAWLFGRIGCFLTHDHPGTPTQSWLGVRFPDGPRWDLGLLEVLFTLAYIGLLAALDRRPRRAGFYLGLFLTVYGTFRLFLDALHQNPVRYWGWTVDQYAAAAAMVAGMAVLALSRARPTPAGPLPGSP